MCTYVIFKKGHINVVSESITIHINVFFFNKHTTLIFVFRNVKQNFTQFICLGAILIY